MPKKALLVVAQNGFQPVEYAHTRAELEKAGILVSVASPQKGKATASNGTIIETDFAIKEINIDDFDALVIIGGPGARADLSGLPELTNLIKSAYQKQKIVAAICISPTLLAEAEILKGKKATVWSIPTNKIGVEILTQHEAEYTGNPVEVDGNIITANGPQAAREFGKKIAELLTQES